jgi:hypothetical protein
MQTMALGQASVGSLRMNAGRVLPSSISKLKTLATTIQASPCFLTLGFNGEASIIPFFKAAAS